MRHFLLLIFFLLLTTLSFSQKLSIDTLTFYNSDGNKYERRYCYLIKNNVILDSLELFIYSSFIINNSIYDIKLNRYWQRRWFQFSTMTLTSAYVQKYIIQNDKIIKDSLLSVTFSGKRLHYKIFHRNRYKCKDLGFCVNPRFRYKNNTLIFSIGNNPNKYEIEKANIHSLKELEKELKKYIKYINKIYGIKSVRKIVIDVIPARRII